MILNRILTFFSIALLATSCFQYKAPEKPKNLISKDNMVNILIDAKIIGSANMKNRRIMESHGVDLSNYVFKKYNIDSLQFALSNEYYTFYIKEYNEIYEKVKDSLETLKTFYKKLEEKEIADAKAKRKQDSLQVITTIKDSISNLKLSDSLKTKMTNKVLSETTLFQKKFEKVLKQNKIITDSILENKKSPKGLISIE